MPCFSFTCCVINETFSVLNAGISCRGPLSKWTRLFSSPRYWRVGHPNTIFTNHRFLSPIHLNLRLNWTALPHLISWFPLQCTTHFLSLSEKHLDLSRSSRHHLSAFYGFNHIKSSSTRLSCLIRWTRYTQLYNSRRRWAQPKNGVRQIKSERFIAIYRCLLFDTRRIPGVLTFFFSIRNVKASVHWMTSLVRTQRLSASLSSVVIGKSAGWGDTYWRVSAAMIRWRSIDRPSLRCPAATWP